MTKSVDLTLDQNPIDLVIRIFPGDDLVGGYPIEITLRSQQGRQEFRGGYLPSDLLSWTFTSNLFKDGQDLLGKHLASGSAETQAAWR